MKAMACRPEGDAGAGWAESDDVGLGKSIDKPARQARKPSEGFELKHSYHAQETY